MNAKEVKNAAHGIWDHILWSLAPQLREALERPGRHVPCPVHGGSDGFRVFPDVAETGGSICNTCGAHADGFATLMWATGMGFKEVVKEVVEYLRLGRASKTLPTRTVLRTKDDDELRSSLNRVWRESIQIRDRDAEPARLYLARRGISISPPETLRFHPSLPYYDGKERVGDYPAIISMVSGAQGEAVTIHRIYLTKDGMKAPVRSPKKLMSYPSDRKIVGGAIRVTPVRSSTILVAEGLETALAVLEGTGARFPVWCTVNAYLMENFIPPAGVSRVVIFADKDRPTAQHPKGHGQEAARNLVQRLWELGVKASAVVPAGEIPPGAKSLDWLDVLAKQGTAGFPVMNMIENAMRKAA